MLTPEEAYDRAIACAEKSEQMAEIGFDLKAKLLVEVAGAWREIAESLVRREVALGAK